MSVIVSNIVSVDGFFEGPEGHPLVLNMDGAFDAYNLERITAAGSVLLGRRSFEMFSGHWPGIAEAPDDPHNRTVSDVNREMSRRYNAIPKAVGSDTYMGSSVDECGGRGTGDRRGPCTGRGTRAGALRASHLGASPRWSGRR